MIKVPGGIKTNFIPNSFVISSAIRQVDLDSLLLISSVFPEREIKNEKQANIHGIVKNMLILFFMTMLSG